MDRVKDEAEVIVRLDFADEQAHITVSAWPSMARRMAKLYGESLDGVDPQRSARWRVPMELISFRRPGRVGQPMSPERRRATAERFAKARAKRSEPVEISA